MGANIHAKDRFEWTPLRNAIKFGHINTVKILLSAGAHISDLESSEVIHEIMYYIGNGDLNRIRMFIESGANFNLPWIDSRTPLHLAASENQPEIVKYLVEIAIKSASSLGATCNIRSINLVIIVRFYS